MHQTAAHGSVRGVAGYLRPPPESRFQNPARGALVVSRGGIDSGLGGSGPGGEELELLRTKVEALGFLLEGALGAVALNAQRGEALKGRVVALEGAFAHVAREVKGMGGALDELLLRLVELREGGA